MEEKVMWCGMIGVRDGSAKEWDDSKARCTFIFYGYI